MGSSDTRLDTEKGPNELLKDADLLYNQGIAQMAFNRNPEENPLSSIAKGALCWLNGTKTLVKPRLVLNSCQFAVVGSKFTMHFVKQVSYLSNHFERIISPDSLRTRNRPE